MQAWANSRYWKAGLCALVAIGLAAATGYWITHRGGHSAKSSAAHLDFNRDVQPVLAANCFSCHGPDPAARKAGLRLDLAETAFKKRPGHKDAIVPGHPEESELIARIESKDPHHLMPQTAEGEAKPMKAADIAILREWIKEGAVYKPHWAFDPPLRAALPVVHQQGWAKTPIDRFILARLESSGLHPSPEADKATLIRRVTLDLTGLLPTPAEVAAFEKDGSPQAYERVVDRLLASPRYGEHRARYWMDYARYADTYGLHFDNSRDIWPYRDYVIRSFNENKRFDQFVMEQLAGDMMPAKNLDPLIGSGYVRLGVSSNEGGTIPEELRFNIARERAEAYGAAFLGLTVGCAVCHDHKYDPTTQKDFYALTAFFNNIDEKPFNDDRPVWAPVIRIPKTAEQAAYDQVLAKRSELAEELRQSRLQERTVIPRWLASHANAPLAVSAEKLELRLKLNEGGGERLKNSAPQAKVASFPIGKEKPQWGETTWLWPDFRMDTNNRVMLGQSGDYEWNQAFSSGGWIMLRSAPNYGLNSGSGALIAKMDTTQHNRGWDLTVSQGIVSVELVHEGPKELKAPKGVHEVKAVAAKEAFHFPSPDDLTAKDLAPNKVVVKKKPEPKKVEAKQDAPKKPKEDKPKKAEDTTPSVAIKVSTVKALPLDGQWRHVFFSYDGSGKASGIHIYVDGAAAASTVVLDTLKGESIRTKAPMQLGWRYPDENPSRETRYQDVRLYGRAVTEQEASRLPFEDYVAEIARKPVSTWSEDEWHAVSAFYFNEVDASSKAIQKQINELDAQLDKLSKGGDLTLVSWEKPSIAYADVLKRGIYSARMERVEADTPHYLPALPAGVPHDRLALAKWTVSARNPLTARVAVNRMWYEIFGAGLVKTTEDFGIMGDRPSHPALLDWLAVEFRESGWNVKHMYKLMVMSAAYRQSAKATPELLAKDPGNALLARGPRFRMDAEMLRDVALQSSGLLVGKIGGPSVKPYQPANVWEQVSYPTSDTVNYVQEHGDALYRRSMYTYWKRMAIEPDMDAFDAPMRDTACTRRQRTNTPLQALVTMDDPQWVEAARALAERTIREGGRKPEERISYMSELLLAHPAPARMEAVLQGSYEQMREHYSADAKDAQALLAVGETRRDAAIPAPELAAWTMVASEMLNLDETLNK